MKGYRQNKYFEYLGALAIFIVLFIEGVYTWSAIGLAFFVYISIRFFLNVGKTIDIRDLIILIPAIQWIVGPWLSYNFSTDNVFYYMSVGEEQYMAFIVPATILFSVGIYLRVSKISSNPEYVLFQIQDIVKKNKNIDIFFIIGGLIANVFIPYSPSFLMFFTFLTGNLQYVGLFLLLQNKQRKNKKILFTAVILIMTLLALSRGMFQLLLLWFTFLFIITSFINKTSNIKKIMIGLSIFVVAFFVQSVKNEFRMITWAEDGKNVSTTGVFSDLVSERLNRTELVTSEENINNIIGRINQGWIISRIIEHMPTYEPFANGETIIEGIQATLLPRFLNSNKAKAGGKKNFTRFTGRKLQEGTSMNISVIGEAYANFGKVGGVFFMFFFGLFLNLVYTYINSMLKKIPIMLFFIPLIFLQVVKAENDFAIVLNHLIKSIIFIFIVLWSVKIFLNKRLY